MNYRPFRVSKLVKEELSKIIARELEFPGALATVTDVEIDRKLETAEVKVSILPPERENRVLEKLKRNRGKLQYLLTKKLNIKPMPRIEFEIDRGSEKAATIERILLNQ